MKKTTNQFISKMFENGTSGLSLIEVIVAAGMVGGLGAVVMKSQANHSRSMAHVETSSNFEDVREYVRSYFSCVETDQHAQATCGAMGEVEIRQHDGSVLIRKASDAPGYQQVGKNYLLKASCGPTIDKLRIDVARIGTSKATDKNVTLRDKAHNFRNLFKNIPISCPPLAVILDQEKKNAKKWAWDDKFVPPILIGGPNDEGEIDVSGCAGSIPDLRINIIFDQSGSQNWNDPKNVRGIGAKLFLSRLMEVKDKIPSVNFKVHNSIFSSNATPGPLGWTDIKTSNVNPLESEIDDLTYGPKGGTIYSKAFVLSETLFASLTPYANDKRNIAIFMTDGQPNIQPFYIDFGRGETLAKIDAAVDSLIANYNAAVYGVATGPSLPIWAENTVEALSRPVTNMVTAGHDGHYIRAYDEMDFRISWDDIFEEISKCEIRDCVHFGGTKKYTIQTDKKTRRFKKNKKKGMKLYSPPPEKVGHYTDYDSPYIPDNSRTGKTGDECFRYLGIKPVGSICGSWDDKIGECIDTPWPATCSTWDARFGICRDSGPAHCADWDPDLFKCNDPKPASCLVWDNVAAECKDTPPVNCASWDPILAVCNDAPPGTCTTWNPYLAICEDTPPIWCGDWNVMTATCDRVECSSWDMGNTKCDSIEANCFDWDPSADACTDDEGSCNLGDWDPAGSCGAAETDCTSWNGASCDDKETDCNGGDWNSTGMPSCQAAETDCGSWQIATPNCKDPGPP